MWHEGQYSPPYAKGGRPPKANQVGKPSTNPTTRWVFRYMSKYSAYSVPLAKNSTMSLSETAECGYSPSHREERQMCQEQHLSEQSAWNRFLDTRRVELDFEA